MELNKQFPQGDQTLRGQNPGNAETQAQNLNQNLNQGQNPSQNTNRELREEVEELDQEDDAVDPSSLKDTAEADLEIRRDETTPT